MVCRSNAKLASAKTLAAYWFLLSEFFIIIIEFSVPEKIAFSQKYKADIFFNKTGSQAGIKYTFPHI